MERLTYWDTEKLCPYEEIWDRLSQIEDILGKDYNLDRLRELVEADKDGRCVILPAKTVWALVWVPGSGCDMICPLSIDGKGQCDFCDFGCTVVMEIPCKQEHIDRIGKDVFLTKNEAEAALKGEQHERG